jgi:hypothetical protein
VERPTLDQPEQDDDGATSAVTKVGSAVGSGVIAAVVASLPATMRLGDAGSMVRAGTGWMALAALATPLAVLVVSILRRARAGAQLVAGDRVEVVASGVLAWITLQLLANSALAAFLRKHTHHHGLAGVTFAIGALFCGIGLALLVSRVMNKLALIPSPGMHRAALVVTGSMAFLVVVTAGVRTAPAEELHTAAGLVDAFALAIACGIASSRVFARQRPLAIAGVPTATIVLVLGLASLHGNATLRDALAKSAPIHGMLLSVFQ